MLLPIPTTIHLTIPSIYPIALDGTATIYTYYSSMSVLDEEPQSILTLIKKYQPVKKAFIVKLMYPVMSKGTAYNRINDLIITNKVVEREDGLIHLPEYQSSSNTMGWPVISVLTEGVAATQLSLLYANNDPKLITIVDEIISANENSMGTLAIDLAIITKVLTSKFEGPQLVPHPDLIFNEEALSHSIEKLKKLSY